MIQTCAVQKYQKEMFLNNFSKYFLWELCHSEILCWYVISYQTSSVQFSHSVVPDSLRPHELKHTRPPCPSPTPRVHSNSCPSSRWCHPAISSSVVPFSSCPNPSQHQSLPMSQLFTWGGQSIGVSALYSPWGLKRFDWAERLWAVELKRVHRGSFIPSFL